MLSALSLLWSAIWPFVFGALGWFAANFVAKPLLDFLTLRSQVQEEIIYTDNVGHMMLDTPSFDKAMDSLRRLGAKMLAMDASAWSCQRSLFSKQKCDLPTAGKNLIGLSNALADYDGRAVHIDRVRRALKLPRAS